MTILQKEATLLAAGLVGGFSFNSLIPLFVGAGLSALIGWFWFIRNQKIRTADKAEAEKATAVAVQNTLAAEQAKKIQSLETQLALVGQQVLPLSAAWQKYLIEQLTHLHTPELDKAMQQIGNQTEEEEARMLEMLHIRRTDMDARIDPAERIAAEMLPLVLQFIRVERITDRMKVPEVIAVEKPVAENPVEFEDVDK